MIETQANYKVQSVTRDVFNAHSIDALNRVLQHYAKLLGFSEALLWSKTLDTFASPHYSTLSLQEGIFTALLGQSTYSLEKCLVHYRQTGHSHWAKNMAATRNIASAGKTPHTLASHSPMLTLQDHTASVDYTVQHVFQMGFAHQSVALFVIETLAMDVQAHMDRLPERMHLSQLVSEKLLKLLAKNKPFSTDQHVMNPLTARELEILRWTADGKSPEEIALILSTSVRTVSYHVMQIMHVLGVQNKVAAVSKAILKGWLFEV
jgi:DNA-binding CsgD family transcriptional regulator